MQHRFGYADDTESGWPELYLIVQLDPFDPGELKLLSGYLVDILPGLFEHPAYEPNRHIQIQLESTHGVQLSELSLWNMVFDVLEDPINNVVSYVDCWCDLAAAKNNSELFFHDGQNPVGSYALKVALDRVFNGNNYSQASVITLCKAFLRYLKCCDMEFESFHDEYVEKVLDRWFLLDKNEPLELLCYRLFYGQHTDKGFRYLHKYLELRQSQKGLKKMIDFIINYEDEYIREEGRYSPEVYLKLCAAIYGQQQAMIDEVMVYVEESLGDSLEKMPGYCAREILLIQRECEAYREYQKPNASYIDTGFHRYSRQDKVWCL